MRLTIGVKMIGAFLLVLLLLGFVSVYGILQLSALNRDVDDIADNSMPSVNALSTIQNKAERLRTLQYKHISLTAKADMDATAAEIDATWADLAKGRSAYEALMSTDAEQQLYRQLGPLLDQWKSLQKQIEQLSSQQKSAEATALWASQGKAAADGAIAILDQLEQINDGKAEKDVEKAAATYSFARLSMVGVSVGAFAVGLFLALFLSGSISKGVRQVATAAGRVADGDLTLDKLKARSNDEVGDLAKSFNTMVANLRDVLTQVNNASQTVATSAEQLTSTTEEVAQAAGGVAQAVGQVARGAADQAASVGEANRLMEQLRSAIAQIAAGAQEQSRSTQSTAVAANQMADEIENVVRKASDVAVTAKTAQESAVSGSQVVDQTVAGMDRVRTAVLESAEQMKELGTLSGQVGAITQAITDIASQTNLLALNAAIEAARAGEHGKGFAVVADEVRKLAERAGTSAKEISDLISSIQNGTARVITSMEQGKTEVEEGSRLATSAGEALKAILAGAGEAAGAAESIASGAQQIATVSREVVKSIDSVAAIVEENTAATEEMAAGSDEVNRSIEQIAAITTENSAAAEEVSSSVEEMNASMEEIAASASSLASTAQALKNQVARFRL